MKNREQIIAAEELKFQNKLDTVVDDFLSCDGLQAVLIAGGSCSGKTTATKKLSELFLSRGRNAHVISLDDFYRSIDESVYLPNGKRDIETVKSLRTDIMREKLSSLFNSKKTSLPVFDFSKSVRIDDAFEIIPEKDDIFLIEGLHALNPLLLGDFFENYIVKRLYLYCDAGDGSDRRLIRRIVRDARHRGHSAEQTFYFWDTVRENELDSILPYRNTADAEINTFFSFEAGVLDPDAAKLLGDIPEESPHYNEAHTLLQLLSCDDPIPNDYVPQNSLLREFM